MKRAQQECKWNGPAASFWCFACLFTCVFPSALGSCTVLFLLIHMAGFFLPAFVLPFPLWWCFLYCSLCYRRSILAGESAGEGSVPDRFHLSSLYHFKQFAFLFLSSQTITIVQKVFLNPLEQRESMDWGSAWVSFCRFCALEDHPSGLHNNSHRVSKPMVCPAGYYCLPGTKAGNEYPCPVGTYSNKTGLRNPRECLPCPGGTFCASAGKDYVWIKYTSMLCYI